MARNSENEPTHPPKTNESTTAITLKIHPKGSGPPFCSYKTRCLEKNLQNDWVPMIFSPYKMVGPCASTTSFHHPSILYGGILSPDVRFLFFLGYEFCLHAWTLYPKKSHFVKTCFSTIIYRLIWAWNTFYPNPLLLRIPWKHFLQDGRLQLLSGKLTAFCICGFRPSHFARTHLDTSMYWYTPIFLGRLWIYINILHCSKPCSPNIILQNGGVLAHFLKHGLDNI